MTNVGAGERFSFETALAEVERIAGQLEQEDIGLDEAIALFEQGVHRLGEARRWLETARGKVEELIAESQEESWER